MTENPTYNQSIMIVNEPIEKKNLDIKTTIGNNFENENNICLPSKNILNIFHNNLKRKNKISLNNSNTNDMESKKPKIKNEIDEKQTTDLCYGFQLGSNRICIKPPLPPSKINSARVGSFNQINQRKRNLKHKLENQNTTLLKNVSAYTDQLRLENIELKMELTHEKNAVRILRAQNEADIRRGKTEIKKIKLNLENCKKTIAILTGQKRPQNENITNKEAPNDVMKLLNEISLLKETNRVLQVKLQQCNQTERRKVSDIRKIKNSYELRLTQISKSAKNEINRLLEEIKSKERTINQIKKDRKTTKTTTNKKDIGYVQNPNEMKKLKDIEQTNVSNTNQKYNTTCVDAEYNSVAHEISERIIETHENVDIYENKDINSSDTDSALSSAPQSISPQPPSGIEPTDLWQSVKNYSKELSSLQSTNESLLRENDILKKEIDIAKRHIDEKAVLEAHANSKLNKVFERLKYLEHKESTLIKETHELREQNELLEFRIVELEETNDKWSIQSSSNPETRDMWTDTQLEFDDLLAFTPYNYHQIKGMISSNIDDDKINDFNPYDEIKRKILAMTKREHLSEEDKLYLMGILSMLTNIELTCNNSYEDNHIISNQVSKRVFGCDAIVSSKLHQIDLQSLQKTRNNKIVATVFPYNTSLSTANLDSPRKIRNCNCSSLQESGIFEGDLNDSISEWTQTEPEDFPCKGDLSAEIQKLNKFREKIEECVTRSTTKLNSHQPLLSPNLSDQRRLQYYKERLELLENKIVIYESSGDLQARKLTERLQREIQLDGLVKELRDKVNCLEIENLRLEEEKCEFEEAENDTRLRLQQLEVDLEMLNQRNTELNMTKEAVQIKLKETKQQNTSLEKSVTTLNQQLEALRKSEEKLKLKLDLIKLSMPTILLFNTYMVSKNNMSNNNCENKNHNSYLENKVQQLLLRERELIEKINEINRAYNETIENADSLWAQLEQNHKEQLSTAQNTIECLKTKILQLEDRLKNDSICAQERIAQLEEAETNHKLKLNKLNKDNKELSKEQENLLTELNYIKAEYQLLKTNPDSGYQLESLEKGRQKYQILQDEFRSQQLIMLEMDKTHKNEIQILHDRLTNMNKELLNIEVTNGELREEVLTLETEIQELSNLRKRDEEKIQCLMEEISSKDKIIDITKNYPNGPSLAQELGTGKIFKKEGVSDLKAATMKLDEATSTLRDCKTCSKRSRKLQQIANEIKNVAEIMLKKKKLNLKTDLTSTCEVPKEKIALDKILPSPIEFFEVLKNTLPQISKEKNKDLLITHQEAYIKESSEEKMISQKELSDGKDYNGTQNLNQIEPLSQVLSNVSAKVYSGTLAEILANIHSEVRSYAHLEQNSESKIITETISEILNEFCSVPVSDLHSNHLVTQTFKSKPIIKETDKISYSNVSTSSEVEELSDDTNLLTQEDGCTSSDEEPENQSSRANVCTATVADDMANVCTATVVDDMSDKNNLKEPEGLKEVSCHIESELNNNENEATIEDKKDSVNIVENEIKGIFESHENNCLNIEKVIQETPLVEPHANDTATTNELEKSEKYNSLADSLTEGIKDTLKSKKDTFLSKKKRKQPKRQKEQEQILQVNNISNTNILKASGDQEVSQGLPNNDILSKGDQALSENALDKLLKKIGTNHPSPNNLNQHEDILRALYNSDSNFQQDIQILVELGESPLTGNNIEIKTYDKFVRIVKCLKIISSIYAPFEVFKSFEKDITNKLLNYYCKENKLKLSCKVYYPRKRI